MSQRMTNKVMTSKFDGRCNTCGADMPKGTRILWSRESGASHADRYLCAALDQSTNDRAYEGSQLRYLRRRRERRNNFSIRRELKSGQDRGSLEWANRRIFG